MPAVRREPCYRGTVAQFVAYRPMPCKKPSPLSKIVIKLPAEDRERVASRIVALLKRAGVPAEIIRPEDDDDSGDPK